MSDPARWRRLLLAFFGLSSAGLLLWGASPASAGGNPFDPEDPTEVPFEEVSEADWSQPPPKELYREDDYGRISGYYSCFDFGPYPRVTQAAYGVTNIILCGNVNVALPPPAGETPPEGMRWQCVDGPDAIKYTVPFTQPTCDWGSRGSFLVALSDQRFQDGLTKSVDLKVQRGARKGPVPAFTPEELRALKVRYYRDQLRSQVLFSTVEKERVERQEKLVGAQLLKDVGCVVPPLGAFCAFAEMQYGKNLVSDEPLKPEEKAANVISLVTFGVGTTYLALAKRAAAVGGARLGAAEVRAAARATNATVEEHRFLREATAQSKRMADLSRSPKVAGTDFQRELAWAGDDWARDAAASREAIHAATVDAYQVLRDTSRSVDADLMFKAEVIEAFSSAGLAADVTSTGVKVLQAFGLVSE